MSIAEGKWIYLEDVVAMTAHGYNMKHTRYCEWAEVDFRGRRWYYFVVEERWGPYGCHDYVGVYQTAEQRAEEVVAAMKELAKELRQSRERIAADKL